MDAVIGPEGFSTEGPDHHKYITEGFIRADRLQAYLDRVKAETAKHLKRLASMDSFDLFPEVRRKALVSQTMSPEKYFWLQISRIVVLANTLCFLGEDCYRDHGEEFAKSYYDIEMNAFKPYVLIAPWFPSAAAKRVKNARKRLVEIISNEVSTRLAMRIATED